MCCFSFVFSSFLCQFRSCDCVCDWLQRSLCVQLICNFLIIHTTFWTHFKCYTPLMNRLLIIIIFLKMIFVQCPPHTDTHTHTHTQTSCCYALHTPFLHPMHHNPYVSQTHGKTQPFAEYSWQHVKFVNLFDIMNIITLRLFSTTEFCSSQEHKMLLCRINSVLRCKILF